MDKLRGLLGIRKAEKVQNAQIRELCGVKMEVDGRIGETVLRWFSHSGRMGSYRITKMVNARVFG